MELQKEIDWLEKTFQEKQKNLMNFRLAQANVEMQKVQVKILNELDLILSIIKLCKEKQREEINDVSSINYKKENLIPSLQMVKDHFKNAQKVKPLNSNNIYTIEEDVTSRGFHYFLNGYWADLKSGRKSIELWSQKRGFAEIVEYKNSEIKFPCEMEVYDDFKKAKLRRKVIGKFQGYYMTMAENGYPIGWKNAEPVEVKNYYSLDYLQGFVDGHGGEGTHDDFPDGFNDINEVYDRIDELKSKNK